MFERNRVEHSDRNGVPVEVTTVEGEVMAGRIMIPLGCSFTDTLNGNNAFIEFEAWGGERAFLSKATLRTIKLMQIPRAENLAARAKALDDFDPFAVLGVARGVTLNEAKAAWHKLSKLYHPDRYATADLPPEVMSYISSMSKRVNAAYSAIEAPITLARKAAAMRQTPIYETRPNA